jgi:hypothetical protein
MKRDYAQPRHCAGFLLVEWGSETEWIQTA